MSPEAPAPARGEGLGLPEPSFTPSCDEVLGEVIPQSDSSGDSDISMDDAASSMFCSLESSYSYETPAGETTSWVAVDEDALSNCGSSISDGSSGVGTPFSGAESQDPFVGDDGPGAVGLAEIQRRNLDEMEARLGVPPLCMSKFWDELAELSAQYQRRLDAITRAEPTPGAACQPAPRDGTAARLIISEPRGYDASNLAVVEAMATTGISSLDIFLIGLPVIILLSATLGIGIIWL